MEEKDENLRRMENKTFLDRIKDSKKYNDEIIDIVRKDLDYGISTDRINVYLNPMFNAEQIKRLSYCINNDISDELVEYMKSQNYSGNQMKEIIESYENGLSITDIKRAVDIKSTPYALKRAFNAMLESANAVRNTDINIEYVQSLAEKIGEVVNRINFQEERYEELSKKICETVFDDAVKDRLAGEVEANEKVISDQQDKINQARATIVSLKNDLETKNWEVVRMQEQIKNMEEKINSNKDVKTDKDIKNTPPVFVCCQMPVFDADGKYVQHIPIEKSIKKGRPLSGLLSFLGFKRKSRADIVKLVAGGELETGQLTQIKTAIEKGLTEEQLIELINNKVPADKMKEIIEIAVLENSMG